MESPTNAITTPMAIATTNLTPTYLHRGGDSRMRRGPGGSTMNDPCACGARDYRVILDGVYNRAGAWGYRFKVQRCRRCGLARTDPIPDVHQYEHIESDSDRSFSQGATDAWSESIAGFV